jgi:hypothetical protein
MHAHVSDRWESRRLDVGVATLLGAAFLAVGAAVVYAPVLAAAVPILLLWTAILVDWRRGVWILAVFLPFAGLPAFILDTQYAPILKDIVLVLPLYASLCFWSVRTRTSLLPPRDRIVPWLIGLGSLAVAFMVFSPSLLTGAIGLKVWAAYLPMYLVGYHLAGRREHVVRLVQVTATLALVPAAIGIAEVLYFARGGDFGPLMPFYGRFRDEIVAQVGFHQVIPRIPSTFTFAGSYYNFMLVAFGCAVGLWWYRRGRGPAALVMVLGTAALLGGTRRAYVTVPLVLLLPTMVAQARKSTRIRVLLAGVVAVGGLILFGVRVGGIAGGLVSGTGQAAHALIHQEILPTVAQGFAGQGTGTDTNAAARYGDLTLRDGWREGWYTKATVEFGILGAIVSLALILTVIRTTYRSLRRIDPDLRALCMPLFAVLVATGVTLVKASELDWDPMNVYFFLFAGVLAGLTSSSSEPPSGEGAVPLLSESVVDDIQTRATATATFPRPR